MDQGQAKQRQQDGHEHQNRFATLAAIAMRRGVIRKRGGGGESKGQHHERQHQHQGPERGPGKQQSPLAGLGKVAGPIAADARHRPAPVRIPQQHAQNAQRRNHIAAAGVVGDGQRPGGQLMALQVAGSHILNPYIDFILQEFRRVNHFRRPSGRLPDDFRSANPVNASGRNCFIGAPLGVDPTIQLRMTHLGPGQTAILGLEVTEKGSPTRAPTSI